VSDAKQTTSVHLLLVEDNPRYLHELQEWNSTIISHRRHCQSMTPTYE
jgi:hypothetical protein